MMTLCVRAAVTITDDDLNTFAVVMAEEPDGSGDRLELQRSLEFDEQDRSLGMDTYCTCLTRGECHYGGIRKCVMVERQLELSFSAEAASSLGISEQLVIQLDVDASSLDRLRAGILQVFRGDREQPVLVGFES